jgi:hypothetical protein
MVFLYFPCELNCKLKPLFCCSKIYQNLHADRMEDTEQHSIRIKFNFEVEFELKIVEAELIFNLI